MTSHSAEMLSKLRSQREAGLFCDITLRTNGRPFRAHRAVLAAVSDHFQEIFTEMDPSMKQDIDLTGKKECLEAKVMAEPSLLNFHNNWTDFNGRSCSTKEWVPL